MLTTLALIVGQVSGNTSSELENLGFPTAFSSISRLFDVLDFALKIRLGFETRGSSPLSHLVHRHTCIYDRISQHR